MACRLPGREPSKCCKSAKHRSGAKGYTAPKSFNTICGQQRPGPQFQISKVTQDDKGYQHIRLQQFVEGVVVYGGELTMHTNGEDIDFVAGRSGL